MFGQQQGSQKLRIVWQRIGVPTSQQSQPPFQTENFNVFFSYEHLGDPTLIVLGSAEAPMTFQRPR